eukprot:2922313-Amphidinium_carterae.2
MAMVLWALWISSSDATSIRIAMVSSILMRDGKQSRRWRVASWTGATTATDFRCKQKCNMIASIPRPATQPSISSCTD